MFGQRILDLRQAARLSQRELSEALHIGQTTISEWERGNKMPGVDTLVQIADYFRVSTDYLLGRTEIRNEHIIKAPSGLEGAGVEEVAVSGRNYLTQTEIEAVRRLLAQNKR